MRHPTGSRGDAGVVELAGHRLYQVKLAYHNSCRGSVLKPQIKSLRRSVQSMPEKESVRRLPLLAMTASPLLLRQSPEAFTTRAAPVATNISADNSGGEQSFFCHLG